MCIKLVILYQLNYLSQHWWNLSPSLAEKGAYLFFQRDSVLVRIFFKNKACNSSHVLLLKGAKFSSQVLALSFKVKGSKVDYTVSLDAIPFLVVRHRTWKALM